MSIGHQRLVCIVKHTRAAHVHGKDFFNEHIVKDQIKPTGVNQSAYFSEVKKECDLLKSLTGFFLQILNSFDNLRRASTPRRHRSYL